MQLPGGNVAQASIWGGIKTLTRLQENVQTRSWQSEEGVQGGERRW